MNMQTNITSARLEYAPFIEALTNACKIIEKRTSVDILKTVHIKAMRNGVRVTGTDLDIYTAKFVSGDVTRDFECIIDANKFLNTIKKVKASSHVMLVKEESRVVAVIGGLNLDLKHEHDTSDFPVADQEGSFRYAIERSNCSFKISSTQLHRALSKVAPSISTEETRYYLNGVYMHIPDHSNELTFAATDGHRLARYEFPAPDGSEAMRDAGVIIPRKTIIELLRLLSRKSCPDSTLITVADIGVSFLIGEDEALESKVIDGKFPDYIRVIPTGNDHPVAAMVSDMIAGIKQASAILSESKQVNLHFKSEALSFTCTDTDFGSATTEIVAFNKTELLIGFNCEYLLAILSLIDGDVKMLFGDAGTPALFKDTKDDAVTYVLMPVRV
ncbi:DNA polymerase III subunit beta [Pseudochrobactrum asaccharolyticum]|uniref:Beta sliding clamp n=1 Tax=Pseudochrobactrum asaccharolyticum TaxID=354351 RepID=A0A366DMD7_9HYPH|nr:DNA polymerase III subunit beta [Pseudochrobactrum asaccharolyticum]RBO90474.1 DNA polymerase-3 subunit beta [Pseudochrobactrum asaccharolyticum]